MFLRSWISKRYITVPKWKEIETKKRRVYWCDCYYVPRNALARRGRKTNNSYKSFSSTRLRSSPSLSPRDIHFVQQLMYRESFLSNHRFRSRQSLLRRGVDFICRSGYPSCQDPYREHKESECSVQMRKLPASFSQTITNARSGKVFLIIMEI